VREKKNEKSIDGTKSKTIVLFSFFFFSGDWDVLMNNINV
jgi:hypothetical protein